MVVMAEQKICEMRILISPRELEEFRKEFPGIKWQAGDTEIKWNSNAPEEVEMARKAFEAYKKKHPKAIAYSVDKDTKKKGCFFIPKSLLRTDFDNLLKATNEEIIYIIKKLLKD